MTIKNITQAKAAVKAVTKWLEKHSTTEGGTFADGSLSTTAREFSTQLLTASKANGFFGCPLCQS